MERIRQAVEKREKILIWGDYDVDGVCGTAILMQTLKKLSARPGQSPPGEENIFYFIPDREKHGYGLNPLVVREAGRKKIQLIITVDCGISNAEEIAFAKQREMDVVVLDHHLPNGKIPEAVALVNPKLGNKMPFYGNLCGAGIAFCISWLLLGDEACGFLDLVALATSADQVPMTDENRVITKEGLCLMKENPRAGIQALLHVSGFSDRQNINAEFHLPFVLSPRINAAGRMWNAAYAVELFMTEEQKKAMRIAKVLDEKNRQRQQEQKRMEEEAVLTIENETGRSPQKVIVVAKEGWAKGIVGIVASRLCEIYNRPAIVLTLKQQDQEMLAEGSARSIDSFSIFDALEKCRDLLLRFGGHRQAAGLSLHASRLPAFRSRLSAVAEETLQQKDLSPRLDIDAELKLSELSTSLWKELQLLSPHGTENPLPVFCARNLCVKEARPVGDGKHLKLKLAQDGVEMDAIAFFQSEALERLPANTPLHAAFSLELNRWNRQEKLQLNVKDIINVTG